MDRSAVSASAADFLALKSIVLNLTVRMALVMERTSGSPACEVMLELLEECEQTIKTVALSEFPPRDLQKLREEATSAVNEFVSLALPRSEGSQQRDNQ